MPETDKTLETVWQRRRVKLLSPMFWLATVCGVFFFACFFLVFSDEEVYSVLGFISLIGFICTAVYMTVEFIPIYRSNKNPDPALGIAADGALIIFKPGGGKILIRDKITNVRPVIKGLYTKLVFSLLRPSGTRYKKSAKFIDEPFNAAALIREKFGLPDPSSKKTEPALPITFEGVTVFPVAERTATPIGLALIVTAVTLAVFFFIMLFVGLSADDYDFIVIGAVVSSSLFALIFLYSVPYLINSKNKYPSIGLTEDGVIVIFKPGGGAVYLRDKILEVRGKPHITVQFSSYTTRSGNIETTTTYTKATRETWGKVIFILQTPSGATYRKTAKFVEYCEAAAIQINSMLK